MGIDGISGGEPAGRVQRANDRAAQHVSGWTSGAISYGQHADGATPQTQRRQLREWLEKEWASVDRGGKTTVEMMLLHASD